MKILPLVNGIKKDVASSGIRLKNSATEGYNLAARTANIYHHGILKKYYNATKCISCNIKRRTSRQDLPYMAGAIGMFIPIPLASPILLALGFLARFSGESAKAIYDNMSKAHIYEQYVIY